MVLILAKGIIGHLQEEVDKAKNTNNMGGDDKCFGLFDQDMVQLYGMKVYQHSLRRDLI
jgi:hypothetical protein